MNTTRRRFLYILAAAASSPIFGLPARSLSKTKNFNYEDLQDKIFKSSLAKKARLIKPKALKEGSTIALTAPASHASLWELRSVSRKLQSIGLNVIYGNTIKNYKSKYRYFSAPDEARAKEFMDLIRNKDIDGIMACRGGYGSTRIIDKLDFDEIRNNPKIIVGYSDITTLLNAVYKFSNLASFHGPVGVSTFNYFTLKNMKSVLFKEKEFKPITLKDRRIKTITQGIGKGYLVGGNLTVLVDSLGTPFEIDTERAILFIEEVSEDPYKIDRMLTHLYNCGKLQNCAGIMFGHYKNLDRRYNFYPNKSFTARQVIESRLKQLKVPSVIGVPIGHMEDKWTLPIGIKAKLDADNGSLTILESAVS